MFDQHRNRKRYAKSEESKLSQTIFIAVMLALGIACLFIKIPIRNKANNPMGKDTIDRHSIKPAAIPFLAVAAISLVLNCVYRIRARKPMVLTMG